MRSDSKSVLAPVVLFVYNRPDHTRSTLTRLAANYLARDTDVIIYSDGAKNSENISQVQAVRSACRDFEVGHFKSMKIIEADRNMGLAASIISGVTAVVSQYGRIIVLEDDLLTSPFFLQFMNDGLNKFADVEQVMHISGSAYPINSAGLDETYFLQVPLCWGWATWHRAWQHFSKDIKIIDRFRQEDIHHFCFDSSYPNYWDQLLLNKSGKINTWFIFWYSCVFFRKGLCLFPKHSLVENVGFDGTGVHCGNASGYTKEAHGGPIDLAIDTPLEYSELAYKRHISFFRSASPSRLTRWRHALTSWLNP